MPPIVNAFDWIVARDGDDTDSVRHHDVFPLPDHAEPSLLQSTDRMQVGNTGNLAHS